MGYVTEFPAPPDASTIMYWAQLAEEQVRQGSQHEAPLEAEDPVQSTSRPAAPEGHPDPGVSSVGGTGWPIATSGSTEAAPLPPVLNEAGMNRKRPACGSPESSPTLTNVMAMGIRECILCPPSASWVLLLGCMGEGLFVSA